VKALPLPQIDTGSHLRLEKWRILVAVSSQETLLPVASALAHQGCEVVIDRDSTAILNLSSNSAQLNPDLLILDTALPIIHGVDLCRILRYEQCHLPILIVSDQSSEMDRVIGLEAGADDYLVKPIGLRELVARCHALLRRAYPYRYEQQTLKKLEDHGHRPKNILSFGEITLYPESRQVLVQDHEIALSRREFFLLEFLVKHPYRNWSREQLLQQVWGNKRLHPKNIDIHINCLRQKLEVDPAKPRYLQTVKGIGYRLG
jgi:two-component system phosphate regulon response regulator PhoB